MNPERWHQVERLYHDALERQPDERDAFLKEVCAGDEALHREVLTLLRVDARAESFLNESALDVASRLDAEDRTASLAGRNLGPYEVLSLLGAGGMGQVYRGRDTRLDRDVAIKVLPEHLARSPEAVARFKSEARAVAALSHPGILAIHDFGSEQGLTYAVMELLDGENLGSRLARGPLAWRQATDIGVEVAEGLAAAHEKGIIHRDLKPANIFLTTDGQIKIVDFGIARVKARPAVQPLTTATEPGRVLGTAGYMSPEQVRGETIEATSDIFSLGCVLYEMLSGRSPFSHATTAETLAAILKDEPPALTDLKKDIPPALGKIVSRCLEKNAANRFQSARDLAQALRAVLSGPETATLPGHAAWRARHYRPLILALVAILVSAATVLLLLSPWQVSHPGQPQQRLISTFPGSHQEASFSPDGSMIAFINNVAGVPQVWIKNLAQGDPIPITSEDVPAHRPRWSPRNDQIVFTHGTHWEQSIWTMPPLGGTPRKIIERGRNPNWARDGSRLVYEVDDQVWTAKADGSDQRRVEGIPQADLPLADRMPAYSPDGSHLAFFQCGKGPPGDVWSIPSNGGRAEQLTFDDQLGGTPVWTPDGRFVVFSSMRGGSRTLWRVPSAGGTPESVLQGAGEDTEPDISANGRSLIYTNTRNSYVLTLWNPSTGQMRNLWESRYAITAPSFSPLQDKIAFFAIVENGDNQVCTINTEGGNLTRVTHGKGERNVMPRWSPDGSALYFYQSRPTASFRRISLSGGPSSQIAAGWHWGTHFSAQIDPSEKFIVYSRIEKYTISGAVIHNIQTGEEQVLPLPLRYPRWSRDGKSLLAIDNSANPRYVPGDVVICALDPFSCRKVTQGSDARWSRDESLIYFLRTGSSRDGRELWCIAANGSGERRIGELRPMHPIGTFYDVSSHGEVVFVRFNQGRHELWRADFSGW